MEMTAEDPSNGQRYDKRAHLRKSTVKMTHLTAGYELTFKDICIEIDKKEILKSVNGLAHPGEMLAIMGPSGAGKSTLLNSIAGRKTLTGGEVTLNNRPLTKSLRRKISYVLQQDTFLTKLTFMETLWFTALLRLPGSMPIKEKKRRVDEIIDDLDMRKCLNTIIGDESKRGLSGGEKKRANIACELLTNPALMLLDEPTSGLDSATAFSLMSTLKQFAKKSGKTVVSTIHQPSSQIFNMFDKLLLLFDGEVAYYGDIAGCAEYFAEIDLPCPPNYNLADHILDVVKDTAPDVKKRILERAKLLTFDGMLGDTLPPAPVAVEASSGELDSVTVETEAHDNKAFESDGNNNNDAGHVRFDETAEEKISDAPLPPPPPSSETEKTDGKTDGKTDQKTDGKDDKKSEVFIEDLEMLRYMKEYNAKWPTSFWLQFKVLFLRNFKQSRPIILHKYNLIQITIVSLFVGMIYFQTESIEAALPDRTACLFFLTTFPSMVSMAAALRTFPVERPVIDKERLAGYYRLSAYYLAKTCSEVPLVLLQPTMFFTALFLISGLNYNIMEYFALLGLTLMTAITSHGIGLFFGALVLDFGLAFLSTITVMLFAMLSGGFYVDNLPPYLEFMKYVSFMQYIYFTMLRIDFTFSDIECSTDGTTTFCNQTGLLTDNSTQYISKERLMETFTRFDEGWEIWHNLLVIVGVILMTRSATYIVLRFIRKPKAI